MTTPYGVTERGIQDQLIAVKHCDDLPGGKLANAKYMRDKILGGLSATLEKSREVMAYFQGVAQALAAAEEPLKWITPMGMEVTQSYYNLAQKRIKTLQGTLAIYKEDDELGLQKKKQTLASAPNIVHSFDASMLAETTLRSAERHGIASFAFVHDSYGTHACNSDALGQTLRDVAADMYSIDRLEEFENNVRSYAPHVELPERPELGTYDPNEVRRAPYFFA